MTSASNTPSVLRNDVCEHGVSHEDLCLDCAHHPAEEWVGYPMTICAYCIKPWPCEYEEARRAK